MSMVLETLITALNSSKNHPKECTLTSAVGLSCRATSMVFPSCNRLLLRLDEVRENPDQALSRVSDSSCST